MSTLRVIALFLRAADVERFGLDPFADDAAADALDTNADGFVFAAGQRHVDALQVGDKFPAGAAGDFGTDAAEVFCFTPGFDPVADLNFLAARFALPRHRILRC